MKIRFILLFSFVVLQGCAIKYGELNYFEKEVTDPVETSEFTYRIKRLPVFASEEGATAIRDSFSASSAFSNAKEYFGEEIPKSGNFIAVDPFYKTPTLPAMAFGYLSVSTLTILPAWSNHDGFFIRYSIYKDGELVKTYQYDRERFVALWLPILPFAWINLMVNGEYEVFKDINNQFITEYTQDR